SPRDGQTLSVIMDELPAAFRKRLMASAGFTSDWSANHLIGFGEYLAMYCAAWNPERWPVLGKADASQLGLPGPLHDRLVPAANASPADAPLALGLPVGAPVDVITPLYDTSDAAVKALRDVRVEFLASKAFLDEFRREVPRVRRLLANVPTYMICDDHDVTDDWFMTGGIPRNTTNNAFGKALAPNALPAYIVFQAWGHHPRTWATLHSPLPPPRAP